MDPNWVIWKDVWLEILDGPQMGDLEGCLVGFFDWTSAGGPGREFGWKFGTPPGWGNQKDFGLESVKVRHLGEQMKMWSGGPKEDVTLSNRWVQAW